MHIDFPFHLGAGGRTAAVDDDGYLRDLIEQVLFTTPGERVNRPAFGSGVLGLVFSPGGPDAASATQHLVQAALQQWLSDLVEVQEVITESRDSTLSVTVRYRPRAAAAVRTDVFTRAV